MEDINFCEVIIRAREGERMDEKEFDLSLFRKVDLLLKQSTLKYNPETPVNMDDSAADELFQMGLKLYIDIGTYCTDTKRVIRFSEPETRRALTIPKDEVVFGEGTDAVKVKRLSIDGGEIPVVCGGVQTLMFKDEESMFKIVKACAEDRCIDGVWGGVTNTIDGKYEVIAGTPIEIYTYRRQVEIMRKAIAAAGRPGMFIIQNAPLCAATIAMRDNEKGLRKTDPCVTSAVSELKTTFDDLSRSAYAKSAGLKCTGYHGAMIGGFSGTIEGAAIVGVAGALQLIMVNQADLINPGANHFRIKSKCTRDQIWVSSIAHQACSRHMNFPLSATIGDHPAAGPGTKQYFYESAAGLMASTVCGCHATGGTRKFVVGKRPNYGTPLESRWYGEILKGAAGLKRGKANEIILYLLNKYESYLKDAPAGDVFEALYDVDKVIPLPGYQSIYDETKNELAKLGFPFRQY